jgi:hypothetical protein
MKEQAKSASVEWKTVREAQKGLSQTDVSIIGFFDSSDNELFLNFKDAGKNFIICREYLFLVKFFYF